MDALFAEGSRLHKLLAGIESTFEGEGPFVGSAATPGDYMLAGGLFMLTLLEADCLKAYPKCKALCDHVMSLDAAKAYLESVPYNYFKRHND